MSINNLFKNPFNSKFEGVKQLTKELTNERTNKAAQKIYKDKPYAIEYRPAYLISSILQFTANVVSFSTALLGFAFVLSFITGGIVAYVASFALCLSLELLKGITLQTNVKSYLRYKKIAVFGLILLILLSVASLGTSVLGAYLLPSQIATIATTNTPNPYQSELGIVNNQLAAIDQQAAQLLNEKPNPTTGKISSSTKNLLQSLNIQKDSLNATKKAISAKITDFEHRTAKEQENAANAQKNELYTLQIICVLVALFFEVVYLAASLYRYYYLYRVYVDAGNVAQPEKRTNENRTHKAETIETDVPTARIGFFNENRTNIATCEHCKKTYTKNHKKQRFCSSDCRISNWKESKGREILS